MFVSKDNKHLAPKWRKVEYNDDSAPQSRHGHRAVAVQDLMLVFGGGNEGIFEGLHAYEINNNRWSRPPVKGDIPPGSAAYGIATNGERVWIFGGMLEFGKYSNDLYELNVANWEWRKINPRTLECSLPWPRLGHSFTIDGSKIYLFGGLANESEDPRFNLPKYLNDLYILDMENNKYCWQAPVISGPLPPARESHSAVCYTRQNTDESVLLIFGGMDGSRLGDLWMLDISKMFWNKVNVPGTCPLPRSLHTASVINRKMYVFGGWVAVTHSTGIEREWRCTNTLAVLDLDNCRWTCYPESLKENIPKARAGHSAVVANSRIYIWSGRDGYRKAWKTQVCCKDLWYLETERPCTTKVHLVKATVSNLDITWARIPNAERYIVQIQKLDTKPPQPSILSGTNETKPAISSPISINVPVSTGPSPVKIMAVSQSTADTPNTSAEAATSGFSMSGMSVLASAAAATPKIITTTKSSITSTNSGIKIISPNVTKVISPQTVKINPSNSSQIRLIPSSMQAGGKQIFLKAASGSTSLQGSKLMALVKSPDGTFTLGKIPIANSSGGTQVVKIVSKPTVVVSSGQHPTSQSQTLVSSSSNIKTVVVPNLSGSTPAGSGVSLNKSVRIPISPVRQPLGTGQEGSSKLVVQPNTFRLISNNQRVVFVSSSQVVGNTVTSIVNTSTPISSSTTSKPVSTIPQTDGPDDEMPSSDTQMPPQSLNESTTVQSMAPKNNFQCEWNDVGIFDSNNCSILHYYVHEMHDPERDIDSNSSPTYADYQKVNMEPGTAYRIRVAGINLHGRGPWSEESSVLKTCVPGFPPPPSNVKITKMVEGAQLSWVTPGQDDIIEFSVYLAIKSEDGEKPTPIFSKVYCGEERRYLIDNDTLKNAMIDRTSKPAIIFRIAARNLKGYGPATQVRWLQ